jgi:hypothetical protein
MLRIDALQYLSELCDASIECPRLIITAVAASACNATLHFLQGSSSSSSSSSSYKTLTS